MRRWEEYLKDDIKLGLTLKGGGHIVGTHQ
jgi:hypothetical protein